MKQFFEWGFKTLIGGACLMAVYYMQDISKTINAMGVTINAMDVKFGVAITKLESQQTFIITTVQDHETRIRVIEHAK